MTLNLEKLPDSRLKEAFDVLKKVSERLDRLGRKQRISETTWEAYSQWQTDGANFVVLEGNTIVGIATLRIELLTQWPFLVDMGKVTMLRALATHPGHLGKGVGAFAINELLTNLSPDTEVYLDCVSDYLPTYYAQFGFEKIDRQTIVNGKGMCFDVTLMKFCAPSNKE